MRAHASFRTGWAFLLLAFWLHCSHSQAFILPPDFPLDRTLSFRFMVDYQYETERSQEWDSRINRERTVIRRSESLSFAHYNLIFHNPLATAPNIVPFQWSLEERLQGNGSVDTTSIERLQGSDPAFHFTESAQALMVVVMALLTILDPDLPDEGQVSEDGLSGFLSVAQLNQFNPNWFGINAPASPEGIGWPTVEIQLVSNFRADKHSPITYDLLINIEYWKNGSKTSQRFKLVVRPELTILYESAKDKKWFRKDDDEDRDKPPEASQSLLRSLLCGCWWRASGSGAKSLEPVLSEKSPLIQNTDSMINTTERGSIGLPALIHHQSFVMGTCLY
ncbi:hypothetical protein [Endozoicomonas numazuensis]|nr:hypothetical protein [Endozoicomonas numazuensis]